MDRALETANYMHLFNEVLSTLKEQAREIEVLTVERDNALYAVEGLERELLEAEATRYSPTEW